LADVTLRPATEEDASDIKALIRLVRINPMDLGWRRFVVAASADGELAACAQVKPHADGTLELASLAVHPAWRGRGLARLTVENLISHSPRPLYLTCRSGLEALYQKFGFRTLTPEETTPYFRRLQRLADVFLFRKDETLFVMKLD
jgi:N-acetylglutamate synthase-like GNAT family acetyltransferase